MTKAEKFASLILNADGEWRGPPERWYAAIDAVGEPTKRTGTRGADNIYFSDRSVLRLRQVSRDGARVWVCVAKGHA